MLTFKIEKTELRCKPENFAQYQQKLIKPPKCKTRISAEKRRFPNHADSLKSTLAYVNAYLDINRLHFAGCVSSVERRNAWHLNDAPTTWPEGADCLIDFDD